MIESFWMDIFAEFGFAEGLILMSVYLYFKGTRRERRVTREPELGRIVVILERCRARLLESTLDSLFDCSHRLRMSPSKRTPAPKKTWRHAMRRRNNKRYLGNTNTGEVHDLDHEKPQCQIDTIIRSGHAVYFVSLRDAQRQGYKKRCGHCIENSKR